MIVDGLGNTIHAIVVRTVVHDNASKIPVRLILDGLDCVGDEARIIPIDDNDVYGRLFYEILHNNPAYLFDASGSLGAAGRRHSVASSGSNVPAIATKSPGLLNPLFRPKSRDRFAKGL